MTLEQKEISPESELDQLIQLLNGLLMGASTPAMPKDLENNKKIKKIYDYMVVLRELVASYAKGEFSADRELKGYIGGSLKALQGNLRHLSWQVEMVAAGDFSQRVEFMGEFAIAFNSMVVRLHRSLEDLRQHEELLTSFTESLKEEIAVRIKAEEALRISEERYRTLSAQDPLTGQYNRRHFFNLAISEFSRLKRNNGTLTLCMMDVDHFKNFNDTYGHLNGDLALQQLGKISADSLRQMDFLGRYGGEEFIFLLPETDHDLGMQIAERLRNSIAATPVKLENGKSANITVSIGLTAVDGKSITGKPNSALREAIQTADNALYKAKADGRNRVVSCKQLI